MHLARLARLAATFLVLFALCLGIVLDQGRATPFDRRGIPADAPVTKVVPRLGDEDPSHYLTIGSEIADQHGIPVTAYKYLNLWPPGMHFYFAALFTIFGPTMPVGVVAGIAMALLWALVLTAYVDLLLRYLHWLVVAAMIALVLVSDLMRSWIIGEGLYWSEGLYTVLVLAALYAAARTVTARSDRTRLGWAAAVGALLGLSSYVRTVSELLGWLMIGVLTLWGAWALVRAWWRRAEPEASAASPAPGRHRSLLLLLLLLVCVIGFQVVTAPWRLYAAQDVRPGSYAWTLATNRYWHQSWIPDRVLAARGRTFLLAGRPNSACKVEPKTCARIARYELRQLYPYSGLGRYTELVYRGLAIRAVLAHPLEYAGDRLRFFRRAWFWRPDARSTELPQNIVATVVVIAGLGLSLRRLLKVGPDLVALAYPGLVFASLAPFVFLQFEPRYFVTVKLVAVFGVFVLVALDPGVARALRVARPGPDARPGVDDAPALQDG